LTANWVAIQWLLEGEPSQYVTNTEINYSAFYPHGIGESSTGLSGWGYIYLCRVTLASNNMAGDSAALRWVSHKELYTPLSFLYTPCPKISSTPVSNTPNSVCSLWISTTYHTLHYLNITYGHTHYDICTLPYVLSVTSL